MIFSHDESKRILRGAQTFDVRRVQYHQRRHGSFKRPCPYPPGSAHAITVRGVKRTEPKHLLVLTATETVIGTLTFTQARAMGYKTTAEMHAGLVQRWKIGPVNDGVYLGSLDSDWPVWALTFEIARDLPRLLRAGMGREGDPDGDYTHSAREAMALEPECVDALAQNLITLDVRSVEQQRLERETRPVVQALTLGIAELEARGDIGDTAVRRLRRMRMDLVRLQDELRAA